MDIGAETEYQQQGFKKVQHGGEEIAGKEFYDCRFMECTFNGATLKNCRFVNCTFQKCDLSLVHLNGSAFRDTTFEKCKVVGINWTEAKWNAKTSTLYSVHFVESVLNYSTFIGLNLKGMKLTQCVAHDVDFADADLTRVDARGTDFTDSRFMHTNLTEADFNGAKGYAVVATLNTLKKTKFSLPDALTLLYGLDIVLSDEDQGVLNTLARKD